MLQDAVIQLRLGTALQEAHLHVYLSYSDGLFSQSQETLYALEAAII